MGADAMSDRAANALPVNPSQAAVVAFLASPRAFGGAKPARIDTHLSHVFLARDRAYKIKRAVRYDFVDFSTIERRRQACEDEVALNRRTAPNMYLGAVPIYLADAGVDWRGDGEPIEWAVEMKRFDAALQFDRMAANGALEADMMLRLADKLASFHLGAERHSLRDGADRVCRIIAQISSSLSAHGADATQARSAARWRDLVIAEVERRRGQLNARGRRGCIRRCHGDLHLANICVLEGEPTPFDAIEFNDDLAIIDVLYDLAFLLMDLTRYQREDLSNAVLNRYLSLTRDYRGCALLRLFQSMRAAVRAMVLSLPGQPAGSKENAAAYLDLANQLLQDGDPRIVAVGGYSGSGKSMLAAALAFRINLPVGAILLQSDVIRKRLHRVPPEERLDESAYSSADSTAVYRRMVRDAARAVEAGLPVILDATFLDPAARRQAVRLAERAGVRFDGLWLDAPRQVLMKRVLARASGISDADIRVLEKQLSAGTPPGDWRIIDAGRGPEQSLSEALVSISSKP